MHKRSTSSSSNSLSRSVCLRFGFARFTKFFSLFIALTLAGSLSGFSFAHADTDQLDEASTQTETLTPQADTTITNKTTTWSNGVYTLSNDVTITSRIQVSMGTVTLQLDEGCTLNAEGGISVPIGATLIIQGSGTLNASTDKRNARCAVIGGEGTASDNPTSLPGTGTIEIRSGNINVSRGVDGTETRGAGIGSGYNCVSGNVIISGGLVQVDADRQANGDGAAIGSGSGASAGGINITINGGTVIAHGTSAAFAIGGGSYYTRTGNVSIAGGKVTAIGEGGFGGIGGIPQGKFSLGNLAVADPSTVQLFTSSMQDNLLENNPNLNGIIFVNDKGTVYGNAALESDLELTSDQQLTISPDATFTIPQDVSLQDNGEIINNGTLLNNGSITGMGAFTNNGTLTNTGVFFPQPVTFDTDGGSPVDSITVNKGSSIGSIADPTREGYRFDGWFSDSSLLHPWNLATDTVDAPLTLYAKWSPNTVEPDPDDPVSPDNPKDPDDPGEPVTPSDPDGDNNEDNTNKDLDKDSNDPTDNSNEQKGNEDDNTGKQPASDDGSLLPHLGDQVLIIPVFLGMIGILVALNLDKAKRSRKTRSL